MNRGNIDNLERVSGEDAGASVIQAQETRANRVMERADFGADRITGAMRPGAGGDGRGRYARPVLWGEVLGHLCGLRHGSAVEVSDYRFDERRERFGIDCIAVTAQSSHTGGSLMSQRECAGFNRPPLSISAEEPVSRVPSEHRRIGSPVVPQSAMSAAVAITKPAPFELPCFSFSFWRRASVTSQLLLMLKQPASGVGQPANSTQFGNSLFLCEAAPALPRLSAASGVGHPESAISDVRAAEARSRKRDKPVGVAHCFHVSLYKIEPWADAAARNLLSKDDCRLALLDEVEEGGPQVPLVSKPFSFACRAERLARARSGPDRTIVGPPGAAQSLRPHSNSGEEVALSKSSKLIWSNIFDAPFIHDAGRDVASGDQFAEPSRSEWVDLVVIGAGHLPPHRSRQPGGGGGLLATKCDRSGGGGVLAKPFDHSEDRALHFEASSVVPKMIAERVEEGGCDEERERLNGEPFGKALERGILAHAAACVRMRSASLTAPPVAAAIFTAKGSEGCLCP